VEGPAGVGKSSLIAVAGYRMRQASIEAKDGSLYLPTKTLFQATESLDEFESHVWLDVAQCLIDNAEAFRQCGIDTPSVSALDRWLNEAQYRSGSAGGGGFSLQYGLTPNTSTGFSQSGFRRAVLDELEKLFPAPSNGGIICVLDNLELLQTSATARQVLEDLRDRLFNVPQLRWVLCGSRGIVSRARSARMSGFFESPMMVGPLSRDESVELVAKRIDLYKNVKAEAPVSPQSFEYLYRALNSNLRDSLAYAQEFSSWLYEEYIAVDKSLPGPVDRSRLLEAWLTDLSDRAVADARGIQPRVWQFFDALGRANGSCRANEWADFSFTTQQQMSSSVTALENVNLVLREIDPENSARSIASMTPLGWLVHFQRSSYALPLTEVVDGDKAGPARR
jgi:DNA-binding MarR family transcriptional regulator